MEDKVFEITARTVTVEVTDRNTGKVYRRELPIDYYENANCIRMQGERLDGGFSELVFYSQRGLQRLKDLTGAGADHDGCKDK